MLTNDGIHFQGKHSANERTVSRSMGETQARIYIYWDLVVRNCCTKVAAGSYSSTDLVLFVIDWAKGRGFFHRTASG